MNPFTQLIGLTMIVHLFIIVAQKTVVCIRSMRAWIVRQHAP